MRREVNSSVSIYRNDLDRKGAIESRQSIYFVKMMLCDDLAGGTYVYVETSLFFKN
jgi:hypothetical protein